MPAFASVLAKLPVDAPRAQKILQILLREKVLVKIAQDLVFHRTALARLCELLVEVPQRARRAAANHCIQGTYGRDAEVRDSPAGAPGPRAGDAAGGG